MNTHDSDHDRTAELLSATLADEAASVQTSPGSLQEIQRRTSTSPKSARGRWVWAAGAAALATAAVVTGIVAVGSGGDDSTGTPIVDQPSTSSGDLTAGFPVWFYGAQPGNPEGPGAGDPSVFAPLYSEEHIEDATDGSLAEQAVRTFLTARPFDPDYTTGWPNGVEVDDVATDGGLTTIAMSGTPDLASRRDLTSGEAQSAIQAMLRTAGATERAAFTYNGESLDTLFGHAVSPEVEVLPYGQGTMDSLRAAITVDLTEGQTLANPVTVPVTGNVFEGNVNWVLTDGSGATVDEGFVTTSMGSWTTATVDLGQLDPGTYTFKAYEISAADGDEINVDTKTFTVN